MFICWYIRQVIYEKIKQDVGKRDLCERKGIEIIEAELCKDHIHMLVRISFILTNSKIVDKSE